jgi:hypothetical protein
MSYTTENLVTNEETTFDAPPQWWGEWTDEDMDMMCEAPSHVLDRLDAKDESEVD